MASRRPTFPRTVVEFQRRFPSEEACEAYLAECRWPDGFACPRCGHRKAWTHAARRLRECAACGYQVSTTAGTILHRTRTPLLTWFWAAFLMIIDKRGLSALELDAGLLPARLRARLVSDDTAVSLVGFVQEVVEVGSVIVTDGSPGYLALREAGFYHERIVEGDGAAFVNPVPHLHHTVGNLKSWLVGTHKGVSRDHLASYLDEFVFRHNRRTNLGAAFQTLLGLGTSREPTTYATITGAQDLPKITYAPSVKASGVRRRRARFTPVAPTYPTTPDPDHNLWGVPE